jgi:Carboxypeptidase regulatory-like domain
VATAAPYAALASAGALTVAGRSVSLTVAFVPKPATVVGAVVPGSAAVDVNGSHVDVSAGNYTLTLAPGSYSIEATAPGYLTLWRNVTVAPGQVLHLDLTLTPAPRPPPPPASGGPWPGTAGLLLLVLAGAVAVVAAAAAFGATRRGRRRAR